VAAGDDRDLPLKIESLGIAIAFLLSGQMDRERSAVYIAFRTSFATNWPLTIRIRTISNEDKNNDAMGRRDVILNQYKSSMRDGRADLFFLEAKKCGRVTTNCL